MGKLSIDLRKLIVRKVAEGWSQRTIAKHLNISRCAVQNIIKKVKEHGTIENFPKIGRPRMISKKEQWVKIPVPNIKSLYESIPGRIQEVLKKKGLRTSY